MKSFADDLMRRGIARQADLDRKATVRPCISRGRHLENIDISQLPQRSQSVLVNSNGEFYFIVGFSFVGGGDVVRP